MREVHIEQSTFERLQLHAKPLEDTIDTVVNRALDALERDTSVPPFRPPRQPLATPDEARTSNGHRVFQPPRQPPAVPVREFDWRTLPDVFHTKVLDATLQGQRIDKPNWNLLLRRMLILAMERLSDFDAVQAICPVRMVRGRKEDEGYSYLSEIGLSFQGVNANNSLSALVAVAGGLSVELEIGFLWRHKKGATHPGERGRVKVPGRAL